MSKRWEIQEVKAFRVAATTCDSCGKAVEGFSDPEGWVALTSRHEDWGNDSGDSHEQHDACSVVCFHKILTEIAQDYGIDAVDPTLRVEVSFELAFLRQLLKVTGG